MNPWWKALALVLFGQAFLGCVTSVRAEDMLYPVPPAGPNIPVAWQGYVGYSAFWFSRGDFPTATTGSVADTTPGALDQPNTSVLTGNERGDGPASGFTAGIIYWIDDPEAVSLETSFFWIPESTTSRQYTSDAAGNPLLARPYFSGLTNQETAFLVAAPAPFSIQGSLSDSIATMVMGAESNLKFFSSTCYTLGTGVGGFIGARWFNLDETYQNLDTFSDIGGGGVTSATRTDSFAASNQFIGGQVGTIAQLKIWDFTVTGVAKIAIGPNFQTMRVNGNTITAIAGTTFSDAIGFYAQPSNSGSFQNSLVTILPQADLKVQYHMGCDCRLFVSYSIFALLDTVRPADQIDRNLVIQPLGSTDTTPPPSPPSFRQTTFVGQMLNLGLELRF